MTKKVIVHEGRTTEHPDKDVWTKTYIGLEWDLPDEVDEATVATTMIRMRALIRQELGAPDLSRIPELDIAKINGLPWKKKVGEPASPKGFGWLFGPKSRDGTEEGAAELVKAIKATKDGKLILGDMEYSLAKDDAFVQRKPVKQKSAR